MTTCSLYYGERWTIPEVTHQRRSTLKYQKLTSIFADPQMITKMLDNHHLYPDYVEIRQESLRYISEENERHRQVNMYGMSMVERYLYSLPEYRMEMQRSNFIEIYSYNGLLATRKVIEFDGDTVLCRVCGDKASGFHYGVHACEGCKGFFRRSIQQKIQYRPCLKNQQCNIMRVNRNRCQYCRLKKCIAVGMSRDAVRFGRVPKKEKAKIMEQMHKVNSQSQVNLLNTILENESDVTVKVVEAHLRTCEFTQSKLRCFLEKAWQAPQFVNCPAHMACPLNPSPETSDGTKKWDEFSECFTPAIRNVVNFAKCIPGFQVLSQEDQVTLLKAGTFEVLLVHLACLFDAQTNTMCFANGKLYKRVNLTVTNSAGFLLDSMFDFAERLNAMQLSDQEMALFSAIVIIAADRPGLRNVEQVERVQNRITQALQSLMAAKHPDDPALFAKLLMKIPDLRTLNTLHSEKLLGLTVPAGSGKNGSGVDKSALERPALESQAPYFPGGGMVAPAFSMFAGPMMANHLRDPALQYPSRPPDVSGIIPHQVALEPNHPNQNIVLQTPLGTFHRYNSALQQQITLNRHVDFAQHGGKSECQRMENFQRRGENKSGDSKHSSIGSKFKMEDSIAASELMHGTMTPVRLPPQEHYPAGNKETASSNSLTEMQLPRGSPLMARSNSSSPKSDVYPVPRSSIPSWPQGAPHPKAMDTSRTNVTSDGARKRQLSEGDEMMMKMQKFWNTPADSGCPMSGGYLPSLPIGSMMNSRTSAMLHNPSLASMYHKEAMMHMQQQQKHQQHQHPHHHQHQIPTSQQQQHPQQQQQQQQQQQHRQQQQQQQQPATSSRVTDEGQHFTPNHFHQRSPGVRQERSRSNESPGYCDNGSGLNLPTLKTALSRPPLTSPPGWAQERKKSSETADKMADPDTRISETGGHLSDTGSSQCASPSDPYFLHKKLKMKRRSSNETISSESSLTEQDVGTGQHAISTMLYPMIPTNTATDFIPHPTPESPALKARLPRDIDRASYVAERLISVVRTAGGIGHPFSNRELSYTNPASREQPPSQDPRAHTHPMVPDLAHRNLGSRDPALRDTAPPGEGRLQAEPPLLSKTPPFGGEIEISECPNSPPMLTPETDMQKDGSGAPGSLDKQRSPINIHTARDFKTLGHHSELDMDRVGKESGKPRYLNSVSVENNNNSKYFNGEGPLAKSHKLRCSEEVEKGSKAGPGSGGSGPLASQLSNGLCGGLPYSSGGVSPHPAYLPLPFTTMHPALIYQYNQMAAAHQMAQLQHLQMAQAQMALHHQVALGKPEGHHQGASQRKDQEVSRDDERERAALQSELVREGHPLNLTKPPDVAPHPVSVKPEPL